MCDARSEAQGHAESVAPAARAAGLRVVLLEPRRGANVGAVCRAIKNMGAGALVVVGGEYDVDEARRTSVHARDVFDARIEAHSFEEAVAPSAWVIGTTSRENPWHVPVRSVDEVFAEARTRSLAASDVALVFGREDRGLSNVELSRCHALATIDTAGEYASLNLAQAAVVCLYEWLRSGRAVQTSAAQASEQTAASPADVAQGDGRAASAASVRDALADVAAVLEEIGFLQGDNAERVMASVASMLTRGGLAERDVRILRGIVRQVRWASRRGSS